VGATPHHTTSALACDLVDGVVCHVRPLMYYATTIAEYWCRTYGICVCVERGNLQGPYLSWQDAWVARQLDVSTGCMHGDSGLLPSMCICATNMRGCSEMAPMCCAVGNVCMCVYCVIVFVFGLKQARFVTWYTKSPLFTFGTWGSDLSHELKCCT
jgi:hypothetical protein